MALETTPGLATSDSYATLAEAEAYFLNRLHGDVWAQKDDVEKEAALRWAAILLDAAFQWTGSATDDVQALSWPRTGMLSKNGYPLAENVVPVQIKYAQIELANALLIEDRTADSTISRLGISALSVGPISLDFKDDFAAEAFAKLVPDAVKLLLPLHWYTVVGSVKNWVLRAM